MASDVARNFYFHPSLQFQYCVHLHSVRLQCFYAHPPLKTRTLSEADFLSSMSVRPSVCLSHACITNGEF